jgi:hypothetical protein
MLDLELAKYRLKEKDFTLVVAKAGQIVFETRLRGVAGLLQAIEKLEKELVGCSVADRVVGGAAAMLCVYSHVAHVFAIILSKAGQRVLAMNNLSYQYEMLVPNILNHNKHEVCPFEKLAAKIKDPEETYKELKRLQKNLAYAHTAVATRGKIEAEKQR